MKEQQHSWAKVKGPHHFRCLAGLQGGREGIQEEKKIFGGGK